MVSLFSFICSFAFAICESCSSCFDTTDFFQLCQDLSSFDRIIKKMSLVQRRDTILSVVEKIVWNGEDADIYFVGSNGMPLCEYSE